MLRSCDGDTVLPYLAQGNDFKQKHNWHKLSEISVEMDKDRSYSFAGRPGSGTLERIRSSFKLRQRLETSDPGLPGRESLSVASFSDKKRHSNALSGSSSTPDNRLLQRESQSSTESFGHGPNSRSAGKTASETVLSSVREDEINEMCDKFEVHMGDQLDSAKEKCFVQATPSGVRWLAVSRTRRKYDAGLGYVSLCPMALWSSIIRSMPWIEFKR